MAITNNLKNKTNKTMSTKAQIAYANQPVTLYTQADTGFACDGYDFLGWSKSSTATAATYSGGQTTTFGSNTSLYAVWKEKSVTPDPEPTKIDISDKVILSGDASDLGLSLYYRSIKDLISRYSYINNEKFGQCSLGVVYEGKELTKGTDYVVNVISEQTDVAGGTAVVQISGIGDYSGSKTFTLNNVPRCFIANVAPIVNRTTVIGYKSGVDCDEPGKTYWYGNVIVSTSAEIDWNTSFLSQLRPSGLPQVGWQAYPSWNSKNNPNQASFVLSVGDEYSINNVYFKSGCSTPSAMNAIDYDKGYRSDGTVNQCSCTVTFEVSSGIATGFDLPEQHQFIVIDLLSGDGGGSRDKIDLNTCTLTISDSYSYGQVGSLTYTIKNASGRDLVENTDFVVLKDTSFMYPSRDYFSVTVSLSGIGDYTGTIQATKNNVYAFVYMRMNVVLDGQIVGSPKTYVSFNDKEYDSSRPTEGAIQWGHIDTNITHSLKRPFDPTTDNISKFWNTFNSYGSFRYTTDTPIVSQTFTVADSSKYQIDGVYYGLVGAGGSDPVGAPAATDKNIKYTSSTDGITVQTYESINRPESTATNTYNMLVMVSSKST